MSNPIKPSTADSLTAVAKNILENGLITEAPFEDYFRIKDTKYLVKRIITLKSFMFDNECHMSVMIEHITPSRTAVILNLGDVEEFYADDESVAFTSDDYTFRLKIAEDEEESETVVIRPHWSKVDDLPVPAPGPWPMTPSGEE